MIGLAGVENKTVYKPNGKEYRTYKTILQARIAQRLQHLIVSVINKFECFFKRKNI